MNLMGQNSHVNSKSYFILLSVIYDLQNCKPAPETGLENPSGLLVMHSAPQHRSLTSLYTAVYPKPGTGEMLHKYLLNGCLSLMCQNLG